MKPVLLAKILMLAGVLVFVIFAIRSMNPHKIENAFQALGIETGASGSPGLQPGSRPLNEGEQRFTLCKTRISGIDWSDGRKVFEQKQGLNLKWMASDPNPREISYLDVEKWLSRHCQIIVKSVDGMTAEKPPTGPTGAWTIHFVDGSQWKISRLSGDYFSIEGKTMESPDFAEAIRELAQIAQFK